MPIMCGQLKEHHSGVLPALSLCPLCRLRAPLLIYVKLTGAWVSAPDIPTPLRDHLLRNRFFNRTCFLHPFRGFNSTHHVVPKLCLLILTTSSPLSSTIFPMSLFHQHPCLSACIGAVLSR